MGKTTFEVPEIVRQRYQNTKRAEVRREAATETAAFIRSQTSWTPEDVHTLISMLQQDWYGGKLHKNRFSPGLYGQHEMWLVETMDALGTWLGAVREAANSPIDDDVAQRLLKQYWDAGIKNAFVFPTAILAVFGPDKFIISTEPTTVAMNKFDSTANYKQKKDPAEYLRLCQAVRALCEREDWPLCLTDAALHLSPEKAKAATKSKKKSEFKGYTGDTVDFIRSLATHTEDPAWHQKNKSDYETLLRDPTLALTREIADRYIAPLDQDVAASKRPTSILKKNDYGGNTYYAHYWFAFFDPAAKRKTESVQLFAYYSGEEEFVRYGVGVGHYGREYHDNLLKALRGAPGDAADYLGTLPDDLGVRLQYKDASDQNRSLTDLVTALRNDALDKFFKDESKLRSLEIERHIDSLNPLSERGTKLVDDMGDLFAKLWPIFDAARTGVFVAPTSIPTTSPGQGEDTVDEDAPDSLADLSLITSLPESFLQEMEEALLAKGQVVLLGPPGTSKTYVAEQFARYFARYEPGARPQGEHRIIYMHASWGYEDFFEGIRPKVGVTGLEFAHYRGAFLAWVEDTVKKGPPNARYVLVLDEINRCDTAAVLGELLQLMEYRGQSVPLLSGNTFSLPRKLYIIGTMNSADRSIGRMDLALRRRFLFLDLLPDPDVLQTWLDSIDGRNPCKFNANDLRECNTWLEKNHGISREQQVGHALFMPSGAHGDGDEDDVVLTADLIRRIVRYSVKPYVRELLLERGRDPGPALEQVEAFFAAYWAEDNDDEE